MVVSVSLQASNDQFFCEKLLSDSFGPTGTLRLAAGVPVVVALTAVLGCAAVFFTGVFLTVVGRVVVVRFTDVPGAAGRKAALGGVTFLAGAFLETVAVLGVFVATCAAMFVTGSSVSP